MLEHLHLSPTPIDEPCQQVGPNYDRNRARAECRAFINQLKRLFPEAPVMFKILSQNHDFGSYLDVIVSYDGNDDAATDAAYEIEGNLPENWDAEARVELGLDSSADDDEPDENAMDIRSVLRRRDGLSVAEADRVVAHLKECMVEAIANGEDPSDVLADEVGLEPDFIDELL